MLAVSSFSYGLPKPAEVAGMTGREMLQAMIDRKIHAPPIAQTLNFWIVEVGDGYALFEGETKPDFLRIDEMRHAEAFAPRFLVRVEIDADDHVGANQAQPLNNVEADAAEPEHHRAGADLDLGGVDDRADAGGDAAADVADLVERRVVASRCRAAERDGSADIARLGASLQRARR